MWNEISHQENRRRHTRFPATINRKCWVVELRTHRVVTGVVLDVSADGLGVLLAGNIVQGERCRLMTLGTDSTFDVKWSRSVGEGFFQVGLCVNEDCGDLTNLFRRILVAVA